MNYFRYISVFLLLNLIISCGTEPMPEKKAGYWQNEGLGNQVVNAFDYSNSTIFIATETNMFKKKVSGNENQWVNLDLEINTENSEFGDLLLSDETLFVVVRNTTEFHSLPDNYISLYKSLDKGESWEPIQITLEEREKPYVLNRLARGGSSIYADWHLIFKSDFSGENWKLLNDESLIGNSEFLYVSNEHPNQIWTGGWMEIFSPYLAKSEDGGETWANLNENIYFNSDATVYAASIHPEHEQTVLVGVGGSVGPANVIRKSKNGGDTWNTVLEGYNIRVLKNSERNANHVYASGIAQDGKLFVAISRNYGDSWEIETYTDNPAGIKTNDMVVIAQGDKEILYFGTNKGVYSYTFEK